MAEKRILLIDDEELVLEELSETFEFEGFDVATAASGEEALRIPDIDGIDVVVSDLKMPGMNGIELFRTFRNRPDFDASMILLSGHGAQEERDQALELGVYACLSKPIDVVELVAVVVSTFEVGR